jgi:hypothetical protein
VGKTFLWNKLLEQAVEEATFAMRRYGYVSLFGLNSLESLKLTIFENTEFVVEEPQSSARVLLQKGAKLLREAQRYKELLKEIPVVGSVAGALTPLYFQAIRDEVICLDDLERRSKGLSIAEILGLVSFLREQRRCKIAILFNEEELSGEDRGEFESYAEKVVDTSIVFSPTPREAASIAIDKKSKSAKRLAENVEKLGISNIRVIRKILRAIENVKPLLSRYHDTVLIQAETTLALFGWSLFQPTEAPSVEFLQAWNSYTYDPKADHSEETRWAALMRSYNFTNCDDFDLALLDGLRSGVFDPKTIKKLGESLDVAARKGKDGVSLSSAWKRYRESFDDDERDFVDNLVGFVKADIARISVRNLDEIVVTMRRLGHSSEAEELIGLFMREHWDEERDFFDLERHRGLEPVADPELTRLMSERYEELKPKFVIREVLAHYAGVTILDEERRAFLADADVGEYLKLFRTTKGEALSRYVRACLSADRIVNASSEERTISAKAKAALKTIGGESRLNAERVRTLYGITIDEPAA